MRRSSAVLLVPSALILAACGTDRAGSPQRDLTLLPATESATPAVASARELDLPRAEPATIGGRDATLRRPVAARERGREAQPTQPVEAVAAAPAPQPAPGQAAPAPERTVIVAGAGRALEPGQVATAIPATSAAGPGHFPVTDLSTERGIRSRPVVIIDVDRCIPGRGQVIPAGLH